MLQTCENPKSHLDTLVSHDVSSHYAPKIIAPTFLYKVVLDNV